MTQQEPITGATPVRRVVTGADSDGRSLFVSDASVNPSSEPAPGVYLTDLWVLDAVPARTDKLHLPHALEPPPGGVVFRIVEFPPDDQWKASQRGRVFGSNDYPDDEPTSDAMLHRTDTIDFITVLNGEIRAIAEDGHVDLKPGDTLVQRGTRHSWSNLTNRPCVVVAVLVSTRQPTSSES